MILRNVKTSVACILGGLLGLALVLASSKADAIAGRSRGLPRGHSHNDYEHARPLRDAMDHGFSSVEADIYLVDGALLVAHDQGKVNPSRTLQALYLDPLYQRMTQVSRPPSTEGNEFILLIDIKSEAEATYQVLARLLTNYHRMLTAFRTNRTELGAVTIVLSGNRPRRIVESEPLRYVAIDGRIEDLATPFSPHVLPLISDNWTKHFSWRGSGPFPTDQKKRLDEFVNQAHARGARVRFWAAPDDPGGWKVLRQAGVDLLNTDHLPEMEKFLQLPAP